ncbi:hypothetical protein [Sphingomonas sp. 28-62-11]|uniref:hypothetical protein n=1 Tax=Sphingomonas sp. 28-62-11 TaxID=1970432 RepID=UPI0035A8DFDE
MSSVPKAKPTTGARTRRRQAIGAALLLLAAAAPSALAQRRAVPVPAPVAAPAPPYAVVADLVLRSPVIIDSTIRSAEKLKGPEAIGAPPGYARLFVQADVLALVRGTDSVPARIGYILDVLPDTRGKIPNLRKLRVLLFGRPVPRSANQIQLTGPDSQRLWTPALDALSRRIATDALAADAPPEVTGVGNAFHVPGSLPGEGETQIFLTTRDTRPVSLSILRRPGQQPSWAVSLTEIVDESAAPPARDTLLWYRLACALPVQLPAIAVEKMSADDAANAVRDYGFVLQSLGPCTRG